MFILNTKWAVLIEDELPSKCFWEKAIAAECHFLPKAENMTPCENWNADSRTMDYKEKYGTNFHYFHPKFKFNHSHFSRIPCSREWTFFKVILKIKFKIKKKKLSFLLMWIFILIWKLSVELGFVKITHSFCEYCSLFLSWYFFHSLSLSLVFYWPYFTTVIF